MAGYDPSFDPAGTGTRGGSVPPPGATALPGHFLAADGVWELPSNPGIVIPSPGPSQNQWACDIAGFLVKYVVRHVIQSAVNKFLASDTFLNLVLDVLTFLPGIDLLGPEILAATDFVFSSIGSAVISQFTAALATDALWDLVGCTIYTYLSGITTWEQSTYDGLVADIAGITSSFPAVVSAIAGFFGQILLANLTALMRLADGGGYNCTGCGGGTPAITGGPTVQPTPQPLTVTDGTHTVAAVSQIGLNNLVAGGTSPNSTITAPATTASALGVNKPDNRTLTVDGAGIYSVLNGQLATINLLQLGQLDPTSSTGLTISGLVAGQTYALQSTGGPFYDSPGTGSPDYSWQASNDGGTTWDNVFYNAPPYLTNLPSWASSVVPYDSSHARLVFTASATSIKMRVKDSVYSDNHGSLGWQLLGVQYEGSSPLFEHNGSGVATRPALDFEDSSTVTATVTDDPTNDRVQVQLVATAPGGGATFSNPMTTLGDLIVATTGGAAARKAVGADNKFLRALASAVNGVLWDFLAASDIPNLDASKITTGFIPITRGGFGGDFTSALKGTVPVYSGSAWFADAPLADGLILTSDSTTTAGTAWKTAAAGGGGGATLLQITTHAAGSDGATYSTTSTTFVDVDATNLIATFTAPASGNVLIRCTGIFTSQSTGANAFIGLREGSSALSGVSAMVTQPDTTTTCTISVVFYITGISAGSHTYKLAFRTDNATRAARVWTGPNYGKTVMEVWGV